MGRFSIFFTVFSWFFVLRSASGVGVNWGFQTSHPLPPSEVVKMLRESGFQKVKLFDAEPEPLKALGKTNMEVMVGIPNDMLASLAASADVAEQWVFNNVSFYISKYGVDIRYVAVGNEPFLSTYNESYVKSTFPALQNIQAALNKAGLNSKVKVTVPLNADVYQSSNDLPSGGDFRPDVLDLVLSMAKFLSDQGSPFTVNIYPFLSLYNNPSFPIDYAFFDGSTSPVKDGNILYQNVFDANLDTLISALQKHGFGSLPILIGEIGWPTDGDMNANLNYASKFMQGFMKYILEMKGTPLRPEPIDAYLFSFIDENQKSIAPGNFERHWGIFYYDGRPKYALSLGNNRSSSLRSVENVKYQSKKWCVLKPSISLDDPRVPNATKYACENADCTSLGYGTSCSFLDGRGNVSYAFNSYYQMHNQLDVDCDFSGLAQLTKADPSSSTCWFIIMIEPTYSGVSARTAFSITSILVAISFLTFL